MIKNQGRRWPTPMLLVGGIGMTAALLILLLLAPYQNEKKTTVSPVRFQGTYQTPDLPYPVPLGPQGAPLTNDAAQVVLRGNFDRELLEREQLFFLVEYMEMQMYLGDELLFSFGEEGSYPPFFRSEGMAWGFCAMPRNLLPGDEITIVLRNLYDNNYYSAYNDLLSSFCTGDSGALARQVLSENGFFLLCSITFLAMSILLLSVVLLLLVQKIRIHSSVSCFACFAMASSLWCLMDPRCSSLALDNPLVIMELELLSMMAACTLLSAYLNAFFDSRAKRAGRIQVAVSVGVGTIGLLLQILGLTDAYAFRRVMVVAMGVAAISCSLQVIYEIRHNAKHRMRFIVVPGLVLIACAVTEAVNYGVELFRPGRILFCGLFFLISAQLVLAVENIRTALLLVQQAAELERQLAASRISMMLSQIQPHFLYNALNCIGELCATDPPRAEQAVSRFSMFLRGNVDSLSATGTISFRQELAHTQYYLELEQMRFDERLRVVYDIGPSGFRLPPLTLQSIVENAVQYGVTAKEEGGTVTIATSESRRGWSITVTDDGMGFDPNVAPEKEDGRSHVGIQNVRDRLAAQCGGSLTILSTHGLGTTATIFLPKEEEIG